MDDEEYQREYDKAAAELDAAEQSTTARGPDGKFTKAAEEKPAETVPVENPAEVATETEQPKQDEPEQEATEETPKEEPKEDAFAVLQKRFEAQEKALKDTQAWATKLSQERAQEKRDAERRQREATKPSILDANPELAEAIHYVTSERTQEDPQAQWASIVERAHPGVFSKELDPGLEKVLHARLTALSAEDRGDPLIAIREIADGKLEFATQQAEERRKSDAVKDKQKAAMSVPGAGAGGSRTVDPGQAEVQRIQNMTDAEFDKEVRRAKGY